MTKPLVNAMAVIAPAARGGAGDVYKRGKPDTEPGLSTTKLQRVKDEVAYWALRAYMRILKPICVVAESTSHYPQDEDR
jgi:hypothetical protein